MPWQQLVVDVVMEIDPITGEFAYQEFGLTVPRQSGKSTLILAKALHRASATKFFGPRQQIVYTAQTRKDARRKFEEDYAGVLEASPYFKHRADTRWGNGNEHIRLPNRSRFGIEASTEKAGHGPTLDEAYIDEAFAQVDNRLEQGFRPAMITRRNKQLGWISTAGWKDGSPYLLAKAKRGRDAAEMGLREGLAYFEWSAPEDADPQDRAVWWNCMPALGRTITEQAIAAEFAAMDLPDFRRAYLNQWVPKPTDDDSPISSSDWESCAVPPPSVAPPQPVFFLDASPGLASASIGVAAMLDGKPHLELAGYNRGTGWLVSRAADLAARHPGAPFAWLSTGQVTSLREEFKAAGIEPQDLTISEMGRACGHLQKLVTDRAVTHSDDSLLAQALAVAVRRDIGDDLWTWSRRKSGDISPLVSVTGAAWLLETRPAYDLAQSFW